ncbi:DUF1385 domain-containing protein [Candidatus Woesearchaeota archaeon]|nr:MAG: DUF1385 domain-containing protein [Candidatus Woesearchaeota archaeon]
MGGQAVINGVMMKSKTHYAVAVRKADGSIATMQSPLNSITERKKYKWLKKPVLRGIVYLTEMLIVGMKALAWSSQQSMDEDEEPLKKSEIAFTIVLSVLFGVGLFIVVPFVLTALVVEKGVLFNILDGVLRVAVFIFYLAAISLMKDIRTIFQYHGAEHKTVYCYEDNLPLTAKNVRRYSTRHARCGTSFIIIVLLISIVVYSFVTSESWLVRLGSRILLLPVIAGVSYEILKWSSKHVENPLLKVVTLPGLWLQHITTKEPDDKQIEVAIAALKEVLKASATKRSVR